jgi:hypothetical protein
VNDVAKPQAPLPPKQAHTLALTRGSLHLLAKIMAEGPPPGSGPQHNRTVLWNKIWDKLYKKCEPTLTMSWWPDEPLNIDQIPPPPLKMSNEEWGLAAREWNKAFKAWEEAHVTIMLSDKYRDACRDAIKAIAEPAKGQQQAQAAPSPHAKALTSSPHAPLLLIQLGLADPLPAEDDVEV